jgi:hypothetical protein
MRPNLPSLHGAYSGFGRFVNGLKPLVNVGGFIAGQHGNQIEFPSPRRVALFDDFLGDVLSDEWNAVEGTDTDATQAVLAGGIGGLLRLTSGNDDANGTQATDASGVTSFLNWQAANGDLIFQARLKVSRITNAYIYAGFTDVISAELPVISAGSAETVTTNATDGVGFLFDTNFTTDTWHLVGVATDVDATVQTLTDAPVADDFFTVRIEVTHEGKASFYLNGKQVGTTMTGAVTPAADLTPCVYVSNADGTSAVNLDVDYIHCAMNRAADGDAT